MNHLLKALIGLVVSVAVVLVVLVAVASLLPKLPEPPEAPVLAMPEAAAPQHIAYRGQHPRRRPRPVDPVDYPIALGETGPVDALFAGDSRYPFLCGKNKISNQQPLVDNQQGLGVPVFALNEQGGKTTQVVGYSKDCSHSTDAVYFYNRKGSKRFYPLSEADNDIATIDIDGRQVEFVVRFEYGTINRFFYAMAVLRGEDESLQAPDSGHWNRRLVYQFRGGVGIGKRQGNLKASDILKRRYEALKEGYGVVYSTANQTSNHYNIWLAEDTALRVKRQFVARYGKPLYTLGIGGSGGAIQQYLIAQNNPELLDAAIPLYSYPDMVTQTTYVMDCEPLEYFFDITDRQNQRWGSVENRRLVEGLNATPQADSHHRYLTSLATLLQGGLPNSTEGMTECVKGWRGLTPLVHNPKFYHRANSFTKQVRKQVHWSHWDDLRDFYGIDEHGYAQSTWDNVGVQYGLQALVRGELSVDDFLRLNRQIGGWKPFHKMKSERLWVMAGSFFPLRLSPWSHHNMSLGGEDDAEPAPRTHGSIDAMRGAYRSGHVFMGRAEIPIVDLRHYLEAELDMHHVTASFSSRIRLQRGQGHADNQLIWIAHKPYTPTAEAFEVIDRWMLNRLEHPEWSLAEAKPADAQDKCFDGDGRVIAAGAGVWDGDWNQKPTGQCLTVYPRHQTSREVAGGGVAGDIFKCQLQSVADAINAGVYGPHDMRAHYDKLQETFPDGVCDYRKPDMGLPLEPWLGTLLASDDAAEPVKAGNNNVDGDSNTRFSNAAQREPDETTINRASVDRVELRAVDEG